MTPKDTAESKNNDKVPRLITWISKNPHNLAKKNGFEKDEWLTSGHGSTVKIPDDNDAKHDYKKTVVWVFPDKIVVGTMTVDTEGEITFSGKFVTPQHPDGTSYPFS